MEKVSFVSFLPHFSFMFARTGFWFLLFFSFFKKKKFTKQTIFGNMRVSRLVSIGYIDFIKGEEFLLGKNGNDPVIPFLI